MMNDTPSSGSPNDQITSLYSRGELRRTPCDFAIFWPPRRVMNPWTKTCFGRGIPADINIDGQMMQWNQVMSLPITCIASDLQRVSVICGISRIKMAVELETPGRP